MYSRYTKKLLLTFVAFLGVLFSTTYGFDLFGLWTVDQNIQAGSTYVAASNVDDSAMGTVLAQLGLGNDEYVADPTFENLFHILETSEGLVKTDILTLVSQADNRNQAVQTHLRAIQAIQYETRDVAAGYQQMATQFLQQSNICLERKNSGDQEFFAGVNQQDQVLATRGYEQSLEAAPCYITNRIRANAMAYLSARTQLYSQLLARRYQVITTNQQLIITYPELLTSDLPARLLQTQRELATLNNLSFSQVQPSFGGFTTAATSFLPNYFQVFFPGKAPTFQNPQISLTP